MTRQQIIRDSRVLIDEVQGKPGFNNPFVWDSLLDEVTDELARLDSYFVTVPTDIVNGQQVYSSPQTYKITSIVVTDITGYPLVIEPLLPQIMDIRVRGWRYNPETGSPRYAILQGTDSFKLYPTPNYDKAGGIIIEGFGVPSSGGYSYTDLATTDDVTLTSTLRPFVTNDVGATLAITGGTGWTVGNVTVTAVNGGGAATVTPEVGSGSLTAGLAQLVGVHSWPNPTDNCPLPNRIHTALKWGVAYRRCIQFPTPENKDRIVLVKGEWEMNKNEFARELEDQSSATEFGDGPETSLVTSGLGPSLGY